MSNIAIVGRGPVGQSIYDTLIKDQQYDIKQYHSQNIKEAYGTKPDILIYAGVPGYKWIANKYPDEDLKIMNQAFLNIKKIKAKEIILMSTIDALTSEDYTNWSIYGQHRLDLEKKVMSKFKNVSIVRLPGLIGRHVKKNIWFDILHPYPIELGDDMRNSLNNIIENFDKDFSEKFYIDKSMKYKPSLDDWKQNEFGLYMATHPYSQMLWLDIDNLNPLLYARANDCILIASNYHHKPALFSTIELYYHVTGKQLKHLSKSESDKYLKLIDYSSTIDKAIYINELNLKER